MIIIALLRLLASLLAVALTACGGGGSAEPIKVTVNGDSLTSSGSLQVTQAQTMRNILGPRFVVLDFSWPARGAAPALTGLPAGQPFTTFADLMREQRPQVAAILFGGAEVIGESDPAQFESDMRQLVDLAHGVGAKTVLATIIHHPAYEAQEAPFNEAIKRVAADTGSALADVYAIPPGGFTDGIHPDQAWSDKRAALIAQAVREISP